MAMLYGCLILSIFILFSSSGNGAPMIGPEALQLSPEYNSLAVSESTNLEAHFYSILDELHTQGPLEIRADRPGQASDQSLCDVITGVPNDVRSALQLSSFYTKYTHAYNIPVLGSYRVSDRALRRACYVVLFMMADRRDLRQAMYAKYGRVAIMATTEVTQNIPEHSFLPPFWNTRARGLGGTLQIPVSTGAEENVLCLRSDNYREDIFLHEFAHGIHKIALTTAVPDFNGRLTNAYNSARRRGLWANTYADDTVEEYFAEGVQSFFNVESPPVFGIHNDIDTRQELAGYDSTLYSLIREAFPCMNNIIDRCQNQGLIVNQPLRMNCGRSTIGGTGTGDRNCSDQNQNCPTWADRGECQRNPGYMLQNCPLSCRQCSNCSDQNENCQTWADRGECQRNPGYMLQNCPLSCRQC